MTECEKDSRFPGRFFVPLQKFWHLCIECVGSDLTEPPIKVIPSVPGDAKSQT